MSFRVHNNPFCEDPGCSPNRRPEHWIDEDRELEAEAVNDIKEAHERLDKAEEAVARARFLSSDISTEYADAGHKYYAALLAEHGIGGIAAAEHRRHYDACRPRIRAEVRDDLVSRGIIRVMSDGAWLYLAECDERERL